MSAAGSTPYHVAAAFISQRPDSWATVSARCALVGPTVVAVRLGHRIVEVDEPRALGGQGVAPSPGQYALAALGACEAVTFRYWSDRLGIPFDELRIDVQGEIDLSASLGLSEGARPGYRAVRMTVAVIGPETPRRYSSLLRVVDAHAPVLDVFREGVAVETSLLSSDQHL